MDNLVYMNNDSTLYLIYLLTNSWYNCLQVSLVNFYLVSSLNHFDHPSEGIPNLLHNTLLTVETVTQLLMEHLYNNTLDE